MSDVPFLSTAELATIDSAYVSGEGDFHPEVLEWIGQMEHRFEQHSQGASMHRVRLHSSSVVRNVKEPSLKMQEVGESKRPSKDNLARTTPVECEVEQQLAAKDYDAKGIFPPGTSSTPPKRSLRRTKVPAKYSE
ncbi:unnamed protein product [Aphanomyces euteiches]|nr:hypothetical protein AeRB84_019870 [Aphanomyces euteiches]